MLRARVVVRTLKMKISQSGHNCLSKLVIFCSFSTKTRESNCQNCFERDLKTKRKSAERFTILKEKEK